MMLEPFQSFVWKKHNFKAVGAPAQPLLSYAQTRNRGLSCKHAVASICYAYFSCALELDDARQ